MASTNKKEHKLPLHFYQSTDVNAIAKSLLGKILSTNIDGKLTSGIIVETEAYGGVTDKASHAYNGRFTNRTKVIYEPAGVTYVYQCYGIHFLLNIVTALKDVPHAVLIRAIEPIEGIDIMMGRRGMETFKATITKGPGALAKAMGIDMSLNKKDILGDEIWISDNGTIVPEDQIVACPRIGVDYAGEDALLPWRYYVKDNKFVSRVLKTKKALVSG
jgi:DNA-3-methyladenine glycosylase